MAAVSPSSSPRLPSPPPIAEDQIGPASPGVSLYDDHSNFPGSNGIDRGATRRIRPGTRAEDMAEGPPLVELQDIDSAFQLTEHLKALHYNYTHPPESDALHPITADIARQLATPPANTSKDIWLYELGRFLIQKTNTVIVALFADTPACSAQTCPEMRASEWQYLCAVHDPPKSCSAIDYCCHTLDWAATTLTSSKMFPSRLGLGSGSGIVASNDKVLAQQMKEIKNIFRRVYRIYAHAWFQHREMFWRVEGKTGLYVLFKTVCDEYGIIEPENYTIPAEAEGLEPEQEEERGEPQQSFHVLKREGGSTAKEEPLGNEIVASGDTTKRHRHTMSDRASSISTVIQEEAEEEDEVGAGKLSSPTDTQTPTTGNAVGELSEPRPSDDDPDPVPGVQRSNTLRPISPRVEEKEVEEEEEEESRAEPEPSTEEAPAVAIVETLGEQEAPQEQSAADPGAAEKSVAD